MTEALYRSPAPVFRVDGQVKGELARDLVRLEVEETNAGLKTLMIRLLARGPRPGSAADAILHLDGSVLDFGKRLEVSIGPPAAARTIFTGIVSAMEIDLREGEAPEVVVLAEDALMTLRMTRRMKTYSNMTDAQIVEAIAGEHGLTPAAAADGPTYDTVQQWNQSDLAFLRERARLLQADVWVHDDTLYFQTRDRRTAPAITLVEGNDLIELRIRADLAHQRTSVKVSGYDADAHDVIDEEAGPDILDAEVTGGRTGVSILQRIGDRVSYRTRQVPLTSGEASAWARAEMLRRGRSFVTAVGTTRGTPDLVVGSHLRIELSGRPGAFQGGGYYVTRVGHSHDMFSGHRTHFEAERATVENE